MILSNGIAAGRWLWEAKQKKAITEKELAVTTATQNPRLLSFREFSPFLLAIASSLLLLTLMAFSSGPVTRLSVASAAFAAALVCSMFLALILAVAYRALSDQQTHVFKLTLAHHQESLRFAENNKKLSEQTSPANPRPFGTSGTASAGSATRAEDMPEASGDS